MELSVLYLALCMGVVVFAKPQGEASPVSKAAVDTSDPVPVEAPAEEEEEENPRHKRWYFPGGNFPGGYGSGFGYGFPHGFGYGFPHGYDHHFNGFHNNMAGSGNSFGTPISGRTRHGYGYPTARTSVSFNELENHRRHQERLWQYQQWQMPQSFGNNFNGRQPFNQGFDNNNHNFNNQQQGVGLPLAGGQGNNQQEVVDTQTPEGRTRVQNSMMNSASGPMPSFAQRPNWQGGWNPNFNPFQGYF